MRICHSPNINHCLLIASLQNNCSVLTRQAALSVFRFSFIDINASSPFYYPARSPFFHAQIQYASSSNEESSCKIFALKFRSCSPLPSKDSRWQHNNLIAPKHLNLLSRCGAFKFSPSWVYANTQMVFPTFRTPNSLPMFGNSKFLIMHTIIEIDRILANLL